MSISNGLYIYLIYKYSRWLEEQINDTVAGLLSLFLISSIVSIFFLFSHKD